ncbi:MAG TPA: nucleotide pyrophosphatase, partial [Burkholderiales bacterium]|nr:nucleotide pyrophosphatase [Burkholderiales bacterium]
IYSNTGDRKMMEHGGFDSDDTHVALLISNPSIKSALLRAPVFTAQIAPTILDSLGISPRNLDAVRIQGTPPLPGHEWKGFPSSR